MKYIKSYESTWYDDAVKNNIEIDAKVGDYVICKENPIFDGPPRLLNFIENNIGQIIRITEISNTNYYVQYKNIPIELQNGFTSEKDLINYRVMKKYEIIEFAPTIEELKLKISANKYNL